MNTTLSLPLLKSARVASPCPMSWDQMTGDDVQRYCGECKLHVFNLSAMTSTDAEALLADTVASGERLCATFYRRADGTILTQDCPVGVSMARRAARRVWAVGAAAMAMVLATGAWAVRRQYAHHAVAEDIRNGDRWPGPFEHSAISLSDVQPIRTVTKWFAPKAVWTPIGATMGSVACPVNLPPTAPGDSKNGGEK